MSKMNLELRWNVLPPTVDGVDSLIITIVEDGKTKRYTISASRGALRVSLDDQMVILPAASNVVEIKGKGW